MNSSDSSGNATYLGCFTRSLMFRTISALGGSDSGMLFVKSLGFYYFILLITVIVASLIGGNFEAAIITGLMVGLLVQTLFEALSVLIIAFIFNLFLCDSVFRIANIFVFSGSYIQLSVFILMAIVASLTNLRELVEKVKSGGAPNAAQGIAPPQGSSADAIGDAAIPSLVWSVFLLFSVVAFIILLVRNIRTLRNK